MAATVLSNAIEQSTYIVAVTFSDEDGSSLVPETVTWTLTDTKGTVVNDREDVSITPAATVNIVLSADDLAVIDGMTNKRIVTVEATYNSAYGTGLPLNARATFTIEDLVKIS